MILIEIKVVDETGKLHYAAVHRATQCTTVAGFGVLVDGDVGVSGYDLIPHVRKLPDWAKDTDSGQPGPAVADG